MCCLSHAAGRLCRPPVSGGAFGSLAALCRPISAVAQRHVQLERRNVSNGPPKDTTAARQQHIPSVFFQRVFRASRASRSRLHERAAARNPESAARCRPECHSAAVLCRKASASRLCGARLVQNRRKKRRPSISVFPPISIKTAIRCIKHARHPNECSCRFRFGKPLLKTTRRAASPEPARCLYIIGVHCSDICLRFGMAVLCMAAKRHGY